MFKYLNAIYLQQGKRQKKKQGKATFLSSTHNKLTMLEAHRKNKKKKKERKKERKKGNRDTNTGLFKKIKTVPHQKKRTILTERIMLQGHDWS